MTIWQLKTLANDPTHPLHPEAERAEREKTGAPKRDHAHLAHCPGCRCLVPPDMLVDCRAFPGDLRAACGWSACDFACDGCRETAHRTGVLTHEQLARAQGASDAAALLARAHDEHIAALFPQPERST